MVSVCGKWRLQSGRALTPPGALPPPSAMEAPEILWQWRGATDGGFIVGSPGHLVSLPSQCRRGPTGWRRPCPSPLYICMYVYMCIYTYIYIYIYIYPPIYTPLPNSRWLRHTALRYVRRVELGAYMWLKALNAVKTASKWAKNTFLSIPIGPVSLLKKRVFDPFLSLFWS